MHSRIFEITHKPIKDDEWVEGFDIADDDNRINGVDYFTKITDNAARCEDISYFAKNFPHGSFKILKNRPGETAIIKFVGDIKKLHEEWYQQIKDAANKLAVGRETPRSDVFNVKLACEEPFDIDYKFYTHDWAWCTHGAWDFFSYLAYLSNENKGEPFKLYIGSVFDYHY